MVQRSAPSRRKRAGGALYCRLLRSEARGVAQVGKYRSTDYVWRQSRHNFRRVRCMGSWGTVHAHSSFAIEHRQSADFPLALKVRGRKRIATDKIFVIVIGGIVIPAKSDLLTGIFKNAWILNMLERLRVFTSSWNWRESHESRSSECENAK